MVQKNKPSGTPKKSSPKMGSPVKTEDVSLEVEKIIRSTPGFPVAGISGSAGELGALRISEEYNRLFQGILRSTSDGILAVNRENKVLFANERFVEMWMIPQELMALNDDSLLVQYVLNQLSDPQNFLQKVQELYNSTEESFDTLYFKDGRIFDRLSRPMLQDMKLQGRVWSFRDSTERKLAEQKLLQAENNYRNLFDNSLNGIFRSTPEGRFIMVNPALARIWAYDSPEDLLASVTDTARQIYVDPDGRAMHTRLLKDQGGTVTGFEYQAFRKDGSIVWVCESVRSVLDTTGTLLYYEGTVEDISARKQAEEELRRTKNELETVNLELQQSLDREKLLASTDGLTGVYNHRHIFELAAHEFQASIRYRHSLTFLMFDLDDFKQINDTLGHAIGDKLLQIVSQTTVAQVRASDVVARYGGDEFIVLLPHTSAQQALPVAERIHAGIAKIRFENGKEPIDLRLSIGIAEMQQEADNNVESVIQHADDALYKAKHSGRNRTMIFNRDETRGT